MIETETVRIQPGDCLFALYEDLCRSADQAKESPWDWLEAAASLLAQVPDEYQRLAWAIFLADAIATRQRPAKLIVGHLLLRAVTMGGVHHG